MPTTSCIQQVRNKSTTNRCNGVWSLLLTSVKVTTTAHKWMTTRASAWNWYQFPGTLELRWCANRCRNIRRTVWMPGSGIPVPRQRHAVSHAALMTRMHCHSMTCCDTPPQGFGCTTANISPQLLAKSSPTFVHVTFGRGLALLWRRCDMLCTSGLWWRQVCTQWPEIGDAKIKGIYSRWLNRGSTDLTPRRTCILKLTHQGQHRTGAQFYI